MSASKVKKSLTPSERIGDRLLEIGKDYIAGHTLLALTELSRVGPVDYTDAFYVIDKLGPFLTRSEQRVLLDLLTEIVVLSNSKVGIDKNLMQDYLKKRIRNSSNFGEFVYHIIEQIDGMYNT
ncbi:MAG: hypothetical protein Q6364_03880 [Candidatus Hermodarchaeota archaeon]|nr:hypothetical protein [Candidatus Hermodarchaeota archaeon]